MMQKSKWYVKINYLVCTVFLSHFTHQFASVTITIHLLKFKLWNLCALLIISYQEEQVPPSKKQKVKAQPKKKVKKGSF